MGADGPIVVPETPVASETPVATTTTVPAPVIPPTSTPSLLAAAKGIVGDCFKSIVPVTPGDALYAPYDPTRPLVGYTIDPTIPWTTQMEFSSLEQAQAILAILNFKFPESQLTITDYSGNFSFPPFRKIVYLNDGSLFVPRLYQLSGTVNLPTGQAPILFSVGWFVNMRGIFFKGSNNYVEQLGYPWGNSDFVLINEMGLMTPEWTGGPKP